MTHQVREREYVCIPRLESIPLSFAKTKILCANFAEKSFTMPIQYEPERVCIRPAENMFWQEAMVTALNMSAVFAVILFRIPAA